MVSLLGKKIYKGGFANPESARDYYDLLAINILGLKVGYM